MAQCVLQHLAARVHMILELVHVVEITLYLVTEITLLQVVMELSSQEIVVVHTAQLVMVQQLMMAICLVELVLVKLIAHGHQVYQLQCQQALEEECTQ